MTRRRIARIVAGLFAAIAVVRVVSTYTIFSQTFDEPLNLAPGLEWLDRGDYLEDTENPPLARIAVALLPWLDGARMPPIRFNRELANTSWYDGDRILYDGGRYWRMLTLARFGVLPFLLLAIVITFVWARRLFGDAAGVLAVVLLTSVTPILGHAGVATTDVAAMATLAAALYATIICIERPTAWRAAVAGLAIAAAFLTKFSSAPFLALAIVVILLWARPRLPVLVPAIVAATIVAVTLVVYRFSLEPLKFGLLTLLVHNKLGHDAWFLGRTSRFGWWYYFPVMLAVKTPLGFAILAAIGSARDLASHLWQRAAAPVGALAILAVSMTSHINVGVRHVLGVYPLLAVSAAGAVVMLWESRRRFVPLFAALCVAWEVIACAVAHPDYLAAFNELAGSHPERIAVDSDLDWGQDVARLGAAVREAGIHQLWYACHFSGLPQVHIAAQIGTLPPRQRVTGWIAISETTFRGVYRGGPDAYAWLEACRPVMRVGRSIRLYFIRPSGAPP